MRITTNRIRADFNIEAINRDFAFLRFERQDGGKNWRGAPLLDTLLRGEFNAVAVLYRYGKYAYVMFRRPVDPYGLCDRIRKHPAFSAFDDGAVRPAQARATRNEEDGAICEAWLLQMLFNRLASSRSEKYPELNFCNLTGGLILMENLGGRTRDSLTGAEITVTTDYLLGVSVRRYRKVVALLAERKNVRDETRRRMLDNILNRPRFEIHGGRGVLKRVLPGEPACEDGKKAYIQCGEHRRRVAVPFIDFIGREAFAGSRAGIYQRLLERVRDELSEYVTVSLVPRDVTEIREFSGWSINGKGALKRLAADSPFHIVDCVHSGESATIAAALKKQLFPEFTDLPVSEGSDDLEDGLNFRIIHNDSYYGEHGKEDDHLPFDGRIVRQHLTVEDIRDERGDLAPAAVRTIVKEALIKRDLTRGRITLFDWSTLGTADNWIFGIEGETRGNGNKRRLQSARFMIVRPDGSFEMKTVPVEFSREDEYQRYILAMQEAIEAAGKDGSEFEGFVARNGSVNCINSTGEITLPDLDGIAGILDAAGRDLPEGKSNGRDLAAVAGGFPAAAFSAPDGKTKERLESLRSALEAQGSAVISKAALRRTINDHLGKTGTLPAAFRKYLREEHSIELFFSRSGENVKHLLPALCEIQYFEDNEKEACYFVGEKKQGMKRSIKNACHIRKIKAAEGSDLIFREILPTMDVDFVRTGQSTVIPFPFKFLRESCS